MAEKDFGVKRINLVGASGTPTITSPNNLNLNAVTVAISTDISIAGQVSSNIKVANGFSVGIGTTNPTSKLWVDGDGFFAGVITATKFSGQLDATSAATQRVGFATTATNLGAGNTGSLPYQNSPGITSFLSAPGISDQVLIYDTGTNKPKWGSVVGTGGAINGIVVRDEGTNTFNTITTLDIFGNNITATSGGAGIASIRVSDNLVGTALSISGISTFGNSTTGIKIDGTAGIITSNTGTAITYYGDGSKLSGINASGSVLISTSSTTSPQYIGFLTTNSGTTTSILSSSTFVFIPSSGNLGIGTTNPTSKLWVNGDGRFTGIVTVGLGSTGIVIDGITGIITSSNPGVTTITYYGDGSKLTGIGTAASATNVVLADDSSSTNTNIVFSQSPTQNPTSSLKTNSGLVFNAATSSLGIGTTNPKSKLAVQGDVFVSGFSTFKNGLEVTDLLVVKPGQQSSNLFEILNDTQDVVVAVTTSGNLGIGTTTLNQKLWVGGDGFFAGVVTATKFFGAIDATFASSQSVGFATTARNVIGGIASVTSLTVSGFATVTSGLEVTGFLVLKPGEQGLNLFEILNDAQDVVVAVTTSGNLGIGTTTPSEKLWVNGNGYFTGILTAKEFYGDGSKLSNITSGLAITSSSASTPQFIGFLTTTSGITTSILSSSTLTYIPSSGNLGVGASAPAFKVDIAGDARVQSTGKMRFGGTAGSSNFYIQYNSTTNSLDFVAG
jgi:predicted  nucleic acid-binding Zn-ribbon protein